MSHPVGSFIRYELITSDAEATAEFYGNVIGWRMAPGLATVRAARTTG